MRSILELAVRESDLDLIEHCVTKQRVDVNGEPFQPTHQFICKIIVTDIHERIANEKVQNTTPRERNCCTKKFIPGTPLSSQSDSCLHI